MDRNAKLSNKTSFDPTSVYKQFGNLTGASMRVIVHGFGSSCPHEWIDEMRAALMAVEECYGKNCSIHKVKFFLTNVYM
jgi:hypothetical protein